MLLTNSVLVGIEYILKYKKSFSLVPNLDFDILKKQSKDKNLPQEIEINTQYLTPSSTLKVKYLCDYCKETITETTWNIYNRKTGKDTCINCIGEKRKETCLEKYGVENPSQLKDIKQKKEKTCIEHFGVSSHLQSSEIKEEIKKTCLKKYGVENPKQNETIKEKSRITCLERYGVENPHKNKEVLEKTKKTNIQRYGYSSPLASPEIKEKIKEKNLELYGVEYNTQRENIKNKIKETNIKKIGVSCALQHPENKKLYKEKSLKTMYKNRTAPTSKQQEYICSLYKGELNYPIGSSLVDVCLTNEKVCIEYDGGGHRISVEYYKSLTNEEFNEKELNRSSFLKIQGFKLIRIISSKDLLPSDEVLLEMLSYSRNLFSTTERSWIIFDIDKKLIKYKNFESIYDYKELRKIK